MFSTIEKIYESLQNIMSINDLSISFLPMTVAVINILFFKIGMSLLNDYLRFENFNHLFLIQLH